jgi:hypothetical protein
MSPLPPSPTPSSKSTDSDYVDISTISNQIESLRTRLSPIIGNSVPSNPDTNVQKQPRLTPSEIK